MILKLQLIGEEDLFGEGKSIKKINFSQVFLQYSEKCSVFQEISD